VLVVGAVGLVTLGVSVPASGIAEAATIGAGLVLALLDRSLVRRGAGSAPEQEATGRSAAVPAPVAQLLAASAPGGSGSTRTSGDADWAPSVDRLRPVLVGHSVDDARAVHSDAPHLVVVGRGVLARAVFDAVAAQARADAAEVRASDDLPDGIPAPGDGTAVVVCTDARTGSRRTVVLVAEHDHVPRRADLLVTVGRTGCTVRTDDDHAVRILPVLPLVEPPSVPAGADRATRGRPASNRLAGRLPRARVTADRPRRGRPPPVHRRRAPAHPSPP
ncbi:hypothetical protein, partial [Curtobacterium luteum]|uniref:hypothetical protein n=1 Tax=Curtobacterium luteum TaxID=33881 RepID=UPI0019D40704